MAGGLQKYRHLSRSSSHRQALLRNLVTSLFKHETISTTWPKAQEAQRLAEKLITLGKKNTEASKRKALSVFFVRLSILSSPLQISHSRILTQGNHLLDSRDADPPIADPPLHPPQTLRPPPRTLRQPSRRLHSRPPHRAHKRRPSTLCNPRTSRRTKRHALRHDRSHCFTSAS